MSAREVSLAGKFHIWRAANNLQDLRALYDAIGERWAARKGGYIITRWVSKTPLVYDWCWSVVGTTETKPILPDEAALIAEFIENNGVSISQLLGLVRRASVSVEASSKVEAMAGEIFMRLMAAPVGSEDEAALIAEFIEASFASAGQFVAEAERRRAATATKDLDALPWARVELFGHAEVVGRIHEVEWLGTRFLEVRVYELAPGRGRVPTLSRTPRYSPRAVFGVHLLGDAEALALIRRAPTPEELIEILMWEHGWPEPFDRANVLQQLRTYASYAGYMERLYQECRPLAEVGESSYYLLHELSICWKARPAEPGEREKDSPF